MKKMIAVSLFILVVALSGCSNEPSKYEVNFNPNNGSEITSEFIDLNDFDASIYGGSAEGYTIGLNYYVNPNIKFMVNYIYHNHDRFADGKGKLYVGKDADGNLTKDWSNVYAADGKAGDDYGQFSIRLEVNF